jgi:hypothetical protein
VVVAPDLYKSIGNDNVRMELELLEVKVPKVCLGAAATPGVMLLDYNLSQLPIPRILQAMVCYSM